MLFSATAFARSVRKSYTGKNLGLKKGRKRKNKLDHQTPADDDTTDFGRGYTRETGKI